MLKQFQNISELFWVGFVRVLFQFSDSFWHWNCSIPRGTAGLLLQSKLCISAEWLNADHVYTLSDCVSINHISHLICRTYVLRGGSSRVRRDCWQRPTGSAGLGRSTAAVAVVPSSGHTCTVLAGIRRKHGRTSRPVRRCSRHRTSTLGSRRPPPWSPASRSDQNSGRHRRRWQRPPTQTSTSMSLPHARSHD